MVVYNKNAYNKHPMFTVDWEIFMLKIIHVKNLCIVKFLQFRSIRKFF